MEPEAVGPGDPRAPLHLLWRNLRSSPAGLAQRESARRLVAYGPNELARRGGRRWPGELAAQLTHPLALLLTAAAVLAAVSGTPVLAVAILAVIVLNGTFAFIQELQAERAVEALAEYLPERAQVRRDGVPQLVEARTLVPGDVLLLAEGDRVCADARLVSGSLEVDLSTLTGESLPAARSAELVDTAGPLLDARELVFSGTTCLGGEAEALVTATGMRTELGRIAALTERVGRDESPLEHQVKRVAWLIALVAVGVGLAFLPLGAAAGLSLAAAVSFSIGLLVANVPEGLLPTITLALAVGVRELARRGAVVKRLSAVETLGSTTVVCTDKTGTLTENRMRVVRVWTAAGTIEPPPSGPAEPPRVRPAEPPPSGPTGPTEPVGPALLRLAVAAAACTHAELGVDGAPPTGDPTEVALLLLARALDVPVDPVARDAGRLATFHFDPRLRRMTTVDRPPGGTAAVHTKGAPETVLPCATRLATPAGDRELTSADRDRVAAVVAEYAAAGLRVLAVADRPGVDRVPDRREQAEREMCLLGLVAMFDPPRAEVAAAVAAARRAGIRVHVVTGDHALTAAAIARQVGLATASTPVVPGSRLDAMSEAELDALLEHEPVVVFARTSPEAKLRIADSLRAQGHVVAMTGDGVNDAPALRRADIGVAMGRAGTDVAREAATMVLTDDNFATIIAAVRAGRRVYDNVRKFILYIFTHAVPEIVPFLVFALSGGAVPLGLTVLQILAIDLGTDTMPALALGREPAEPGLMDRPPRPRSRGVIDRGVLARSWGFLGLISAVLVFGGFLLVLVRAGWHPGAATGAGSPLHEAYRRATTVAWLGIVACQIGTAFAARTEHASLRAVGVLTNRLLLAAIGFEIAFAAALVYLPPLQPVFGTAPLSAGQLALLAPYPFVVWGADELRRFARRRRGDRPAAPTTSGPPGRVLGPCPRRPVPVTKDARVSARSLTRGGRHHGRQG